MSKKNPQTLKEVMEFLFDAGYSNRVKKLRELFKGKFIKDSTSCTMEDLYVKKAVEKPSDAGTNLGSTSELQQDAPSGDTNKSVPDNAV